MEPTFKNLLSYTLTYLSLLFNGEKIRPFNYQVWEPHSNFSLDNPFIDNWSENNTAKLLLNVTLFPSVITKNIEKNEDIAERLAETFEEEVYLWKLKKSNESGIILMPKIYLNKTKYDTEKLLTRVRKDYNTVKNYLRTILDKCHEHNVTVNQIIVSVYAFSQPCGLTSTTESCRQREILVRKEFNDISDVVSQRVGKHLIVTGEESIKGVKLRSLLHLLNGEDKQKV